MTGMDQARGVAATTAMLTNLPGHLQLSVTHGPVPEELEGAGRRRSWIQVTPGVVLMRFPTGARLLVRGGTEATLDLSEVEDPDGDPSWMLQGWAVTLAWLQRGRLSLHAAIVATGPFTIGLAGDRGAGKSTTSMGLRQREYQLLVDDVGLLDLRGDRAWVTPYARNVHLFPDAALALGLDFAALAPLAGGRQKAAFRGEDPPIDPLPLDRIVVLSPSAGVGAPRIRESRGAERLQALLPHTARDGLAPRILGRERYFALLAQLADCVPVHILQRPTGAWTLPAVLDLIETVAVEARG